MTPARLIAAGAIASTLAASAPASPQTPVTPHPRGYVAFRATEPIRVDGRLDDGAWLAVPWSELFVDIEGDRKPRPRFDTRIKMTWDADAFYVGAELRDPHVWGTLTAHDSVIFHDPDFEVFIDPNGDNHEYYEFEINALGTYWDLFLPKPYKDDGKAMNAWEIAGLKSAVLVDGTLNDARDADRGWSVEIAFPWRVLAEQARRPAPPAEGDQWRVNFSRVQWPIDTSSGRYVKPQGAREDNWVWSPQHVIDMHRPEMWGYVQFTSRQPGSVSFAPDPSWPARDWLHRVYYAQREYRKVHGRWAPALGDLELGDPPAGLSEPDLREAGGLFESTVRLRASGQRWRIQQDGLIAPVATGSRRLPSYSP